MTINACQLVSSAVIHNLIHLPSLESLSLSDCAASKHLPACVSRLTNLRELNLGGHQISDSQLTHVSTLTNLEALTLWGNELTQASMKCVVPLERLTRLDVSWTYVSHPPPLPTLKHLDLKDCEVGGDWQGTYAMYMSEHGLAPLTGLTHINMSNSRFECFMLTQVCSLYVFCKIFRQLS